MKIFCGSCKQQVADEDRRRKLANRIKAVNKAVLDFRKNQAVRIVCRCGNVTILIEGGRE